MLLLVVVVKIAARLELASLERSACVIGQQVRAPAASTVRNVIRWRSSTPCIVIDVSGQVVILESVVYLGAKNHVLRIGMLLREVTQNGNSAKLPWSALRAEHLILVIPNLLRVGMRPQVRAVSVPRVVFADVIIVHQDTLEL